MKYKKSIVGAVIVVALISTLSVVWYMQKNSLRGLGFRISDMSAFRVTERFKPYFSEYEEENIVAQWQSRVLRLTIFSDIEKQPAEKYIASQSLLFEGMFDQNLPPYPEFLTSSTGCPEKFLPERKNTALGHYYTIYANERFSYGICAEDLAKYKAGVGVFYCDNIKKTVKIAYFIDKSEDFATIDALMSSFVCSNN